MRRLLNVFTHSTKCFRWKTEQNYETRLFRLQIPPNFFSGYVKRRFENTASTILSEGPDFSAHKPQKSIKPYMDLHSEHALGKSAQSLTICRSKSKKSGKRKFSRWNFSLNYCRWHVQCVFEITAGTGLSHVWKSFEQSAQKMRRLQYFSKNFTPEIFWTDRKRLSPIVAKDYRSKSNILILHRKI